MRAVDTNILVRWIIGDDPVQFVTASALIAEGVYLPITVLMELEWVLRSVIGMERSAIAVTLSTIVSTETISIDHDTAVRWAVERYRSGADWADLMHIIAAGNATAFVTFDRRLTRQSGKDSPVPVELVR